MLERESMGPKGGVALFSSSILLRQNEGLNKEDGIQL